MIAVTVEQVNIDWIGCDEYFIVESYLKSYSVNFMVNFHRAVVECTLTANV